MRTITIQPGHLRDQPNRAGVVVWEDEQVRPLFLGWGPACRYALSRARWSSVAIELRDEAGNLTRRLEPDETRAKAEEHATQAWNALQGRVQAAYQEDAGLNQDATKPEES